MLVLEVQHIKETMEALFEFSNKDKRLKPGDPMTGKFGPLVPNPNPVLGKKSRCVRSSATNVVVKAVDAKMWRVKVNQTAEYINVCFCILKVIDDAVGVPVNDVEKNVSQIIILITYCC